MAIVLAGENQGRKNLLLYHSGLSNPSLRLLPPHPNPCSMKHRSAQIPLLSVIATLTSRHSLVDSFVGCRHYAHSWHNRVLTTTASGSLVVRRRRQHKLYLGNDDNVMINNSNDFESTDKLHNRFLRFRSSPRHAPHIRRVVLLSDLHMDYTANRDWLSNLCGADDVSDVDSVSSKTSNGVISSRFDDNNNNIDDKHTMIIIAGDISHDLDILRWTFQTLKRKYGEVMYTPGSHDLWIDRDDDNTDEDGVKNTSIDKLERVLQLCLEMNIRIGPMRVGGWNMDEISSTKFNGNTDYVQPALWVIPLLSWHHPSFDTEPPIECWGGIPSARKVLADYRRTRWPTPLSLMDDSIARFFDSLNDIILDLDSMVDMETISSTPTTTPTRILTFSHFIPRIELLPEKRYLSLPTLPRCVGSTFLESRLRRTGENYYKNVNQNSDCSGDDDGSINTRSGSDHVKRNNGGPQHHHHLHAFGHTHLSWDATIDGVRYVHVPLAYPREWEQRKRSLEIGSMKGEAGEDRVPVCIWEQKSICGSKEVPADASHSTGFPSNWLGGWWSKYYSVMPRKPDQNKALAPWVAKKFR